MNSIPRFPFRPADRNTVTVHFAGLNLPAPTTTTQFGILGLGFTYSSGFLTLTVPFPLLRAGLIFTLLINQELFCAEATNRHFGQQFCVLATHLSQRFTRTAVEVVCECVCVRPCVIGLKVDITVPQQL